jgi:microcystin-dependent protein
MELTRYLMKIFGSNSAANQIRKFGSLAAGNQENAANPGEVQELANFEGGWPSAVLLNNSPSMEDMNSLQYLLSYQIAYLMQKGVAEWETNTTYYTGDLVSNGSGVIFVSLSDDNQGNALSDSAEWAPWTPNLYVSSVTYGAGARVNYNGIWYISRKGSNQGNSPATVSEWWRIDTGKFIGEQFFLGQDTAPDGTLAALGQPISRTDYADLFAVYGTKFGDGSKNADGSSSGFSGTHFNLPKSQGQFMRFPDDGAGIDPNAGARTAMNDGGATGDDIGSVQADATAPNSLATAEDGDHQHVLKGAYTNTSGAISGNNYDGTNDVSGGSGATKYDLDEDAMEAAGDHTHTLSGDDETRPTNAYFSKMYVVF